MTFKKGDKVRRKKGAGSLGIIKELEVFIVESVTHNGHVYGEGSPLHARDSLELASSWDTLGYGDILMKDKEEYKVLGIAGDVFFLSNSDDFEAVSGYGRTKQELKRIFTLKEDSTPETTEYNGKKYNKQEFEDRLKELEEVK